MSEEIGPGPRTRVRRLPEKARYDEATVLSVFDEAPFCHVVTIVEGRAVALPTLCAREGRTLYLHGSPSNAVLRALLVAGEGCVTATLYGGLRLARSGFESSIAYRSSVALGPVREVPLGDRARVLDLVVDRVIPGRAGEVRPSSERERRLTLVVALDVEEASMKHSAGPTDDDESDQALDVWSGTVPARLVYDEPVPDTNGAMASGDVTLPESVRRLLGRS